MIEVKNLVKQYGSHKAINGLSFTINDGEIVGFLGPNGAGKTTIMNIITGYISATEGNVIVNGVDILENPQKAKASIGYLPDSPPVYNDMKIDEYLNFVADIKKINKKEKKQVIEQIKEKVFISEVPNRLIKNLSKVNQQRLGLAQALIGNPKILVLDQPMVGLDQEQIMQMTAIIKELGNNHTIILSSHILSDITTICGRVIILNKGEIIVSDSPNKLSPKLLQHNRIIARIKGDKEKIKEAIMKVSIISNFSFQDIMEEGTVDVILECSEQVDIREAVFNCMAQNNLPILMMKSEALSLEKIFMQLTSHENIDEASYKDSIIK